MKLINSDNQFDYFVDYFNGIEVKMQKDKTTQEVYFDTESVAQCLGFANADEMIQSNVDMTNAYLDGLNNGTVIKK